MTDLPIAPDESGDVPLCVASCARARWFDRRLLCDSDNGRHYPHRAVCLPRIRELVAISRRRCDGCRHSKPLQEESDVFCHLWRIRQNPGGHCNEWAAKR